MIDVTEEQPELARTRDFVDALQDLDMEWVRDIPSDDADQRASTAPQSPRQEVRLVPEIGGGGKHPYPRVVTDRHASRAPVQDP
jgi:hypothetical protein